MKEKPLEGKTIIVTRPQQQAAGLAHALEQRGAVAPCIPLIEILPTSLDAKQLDTIANVGHANALICVSSNAARLGLEQCQSGEMSLPDTIIAVGKATAQVFIESGIENVVVSDAGSDSEAVLELDVLQDVTGNNIQLWRGGDGRQLLSDTLMQRGAEVKCVDLYQRRMPELSASQLKRFLSSDVDIISITSVTSLYNLRELTKAQSSALDDKTLLLGSQRIYRNALETGFSPAQCLVASDPGSMAMLEALMTQTQLEGQGMTDKDLPDQIDATDVEVTETSETDAGLEPVPLAKPAKSGGGGFGTLLSVLAFLLAAGGIGGAYYFYEKEIKPVLSASASQQEFNQLDSRITQQSTQLRSMGTKVEQASVGVIELRTAVSTDRITLALAQVEHLVNIANDRLAYMNDADTAESALQEASERLMDINEPAFEKLQQALQSDLQNVRGFQVIDANEVMSDLTDLVESLRPIPAVESEREVEQPETIEDTEEDDQTPSSIGDVWNTFKKSIGEKVKVVETDYPVSGISATAINRYKLDILRLRMEAMRLSLIRSDNIAFNTEIAEAQTWVIENLDNSLSQPILNELLILRRMNFDTIPNVEQSIKAVEEVSKTLTSRVIPQQNDFEPFPLPAAAPPQGDATSSIRNLPPIDDCNSCVLEPAPADGAVL